MDREELILLAFAVGTTGNLFKGLPQFVRTAVRGKVEGLSAGAVWLALTANLLWACFGAAISDWKFFALSLLGLTLTFATTVRYVTRTGWSRNFRLGMLVLPAAVAFVSLAFMGEDEMLAAIGVAIGLIISVPQLVHLLRMRGTDHDVSGVSVWEYVVILAAQVGWTSYWLLNEQWLVAFGAAWGGVARAVTLTLLLRHAVESRRMSDGDPTPHV